MVFVGGPRQVGRSTLCISFLKPANFHNPAYLSWDNPLHRDQLLRGRLPPRPLLVIDEIHKYKLWRNLLKGLYDSNKGIQNYLVTGSARLDYYRRGGDSLLGRYRYLRLHPLSVAELKIKTNKELKDLLIFGGFPEPFLSASVREHKLWRQERLYRIVHDDIRDFESLRDFSRLELLANVLRDRAGSLLSAHSLEEDLQASSKTVSHWLDILERIYYIYRVYPFAPSRIKSNRKLPKVYLWDWSEAQDEGHRWENMVASHLLKWCHFHQDTQGENWELHYIRDREGREVDFVLTHDRKIRYLIECKSGERETSKSLRFYKSRFPDAQAFQVHKGQADFVTNDGIRVLPFLVLSQELALI